MPIAESTVTSPNTLHESKFKFQIKRLPNVNYFCNAVNLPGISSTSYLQPTPLVDVPVPGDKPIFAPLTVQFQVDENLNNWLEIWNWMVGLYFPEDYQQYATLSASATGADSAIYSDATLFIETNLNNNNIQVEFKNIFPVEIEDIQFTSTADDDIMVVSSARFEYAYYTFAT